MRWPWSPAPGPAQAPNQSGGPAQAPKGSSSGEQAPAGSAPQSPFGQMIDLIAAIRARGDDINHLEKEVNAALEGIAIPQDAKTRLADVFNRAHYRLLDIKEQE